MRLEQIKRRTGRALGVSPAAIEGRSRKPHFVQPRQIVFAMCRHFSDATFQRIGASVGGLDRSTVRGGVQRVELRCAQDPAYFAQVAQVCALLEIEVNAARIHQLNDTAAKPRAPIALLPAPWHRLAKGRA